MLRPVGLLLFVMLLPLAAVAQQPAAPPAVPAAPNTIVPTPHNTTRHQLIKSRAKQGKVDLVLIGDSITQGWESNGKEVWAKFYTPRHALNAGISGDRTEHVLWRLDNGELDGLSPRLAVIMIGTNNSRHNKPDEIALGVKTIVERLRAKMPETKILVLGVFPRGQMPDDSGRKTNADTNAILAGLADDKMVYYLDIGEKFVSEDGTISTDVMPDYLHLSPAGYQIWAEALEPTIEKLLGPAAS